MWTGLVWLRIGTGGESSCEFGIQPSVSIKCWETVECPTTRDLWSSAQLHGVSYLLVLYSLTQTWILGNGAFLSGLEAEMLCEPLA
jgi:hypothetical protein